MGYLVFNRTDGVYASPDLFKTIEEAEQFIAEFPKRYERQGYYRTSRWEKIAPEEVLLKIEEVN
jgi:hypothetical protein